MSFNRKPMNGGCYPQQHQAPQAINDPCTYLPQLRAALYALMSGAQSQQVRDGDRWQSFHQGNVKELRAEIRKLEAICPASEANPMGGGQARAVRAGPYIPPNAFPRRY